MFNQFNDFEDEFKQDINEALNKDTVHIRVQKRTGRKMTTSVEGLDSKLDLKKIIKECKKKFNCSGTLIEIDKQNPVIKFSGDIRQEFANFLVNEKICTKSSIKIHGF